ncbi:hypothetical protein KP509_21G036200 [Ceratopteris richardii]|uniref:NAD(+) kinase n=1 Tax=Ceratopteris richardii TaxID=49495 RepID=A0A8T2SAX0_CERRI|nr:hypothetical protein KP509_21G036200 [Ceratopteris richardii]
MVEDQAQAYMSNCLRIAVESKARAMEEAAQWKRKYEFECLQNGAEEAGGLSANYRTSSSGSDFNSVPDVAIVQGHHSHEQHLGCSEGPGISSCDIFKNGMCSSESNNLDGRGLLYQKVLFNLAWGCDGIKDQHAKHDIVSCERGDIRTDIRRSKQIILEWKSAPRSVAIFMKPNSPHVQALCKEMVKWLKEDKGMNVFLEPDVRKELLDESNTYTFVQTWKTGEDIKTLHCKVDLVITLGGDGTVLWAASKFKGPVPPVVSFAMGSLGFMTPFKSDCFKECLRNVIKGPWPITLRHRLCCRIVRAADCQESTNCRKILEDDFHLVLNEVSIDRGMSSFLTFLECYSDNSFVTYVQGDGLIISTTSGSTAYSLAAGGSMVHPQVPGILFTPICPHSLSFRPLILPEYVTLRIQVPLHSRGQAWASFDGKDRQILQAGDALECNMSEWPVPTMCEVESTCDFLHSVQECLHWNMKKIHCADNPEGQL